jgi:hypothetical protein
MARNGSGVMSVLNTFVPSTIISSTAANQNNSDAASEITNSLPRDGQAGMTGQFKADAGSEALPGIAFAADLNTGIRRVGADHISLVTGASDRLEIEASGTATFSGEVFTPAVWPSGTVRTLKERATDVYHILDAPGSPDPTGNNDSTAALVAMAAEGVRAYLTEGDFLCDTKLVIPEGILWDGSGGVDYLYNGQTRIIFTGTGTKDITLAGGTFTSPISIANPATGADYLADSGTRGDTYTMLDLSSAMSAAVVLNRAAGLRNIGIYPNFNGITGYQGTSADLSDEWDVGVWCANADAWIMENVAVLGHWRKSALLITNSDLSNGITPSSQYGRASRCFFQGFRAVTIRSPSNTALGWGFAGTKFTDCDLRPLNHQSGHLATSEELSTPFDSPSAALEMSGNGMRGIKFENTTFIGQDDVLVMLDDVNETFIHASYVEAQSINVSGSPLANSQGARMIGTSNTQLVYLEGFAKFGVDLTPFQTLDGSLTTSRYTGFTPGVWTPATAWDWDYLWQQFATHLGFRLRNSSQFFSILNAAGSARPFTVSDDGLMTTGLYSTGSVEIADDAVASIPTPKNAGACWITFCGVSENSGFPSVSHGGLVSYDTGDSVSAGKVGGGGSFTVVSTDVSGTTGADGSVTVGVVAGNLRVENRQGAGAFFRYAFIG